MATAFDSAHLVTLFFVANLLYAASYMVRDILRLRVLAVLAALATFPYFYLRAEPMYSAIFWQSAFLALNAVHVGLLYQERRPAALTDEQAWLHERVFKLFTRRQMLRLLGAATAHTANDGETLIRQGQRGEALILLLEGSLEIVDDRRVRARLRPGQFAGEMSLLAQRETSADVIARASPVRYLRWEAAALERLWQRYPRLHRPFDSTLSLDLVDKLSEAGQEVPDA